ncbi:hypothetical protein K402DRAFT_455225 [Aulographum hederae CBS 113979]|uniref:Uncharacterized protein n=1 Tax=Aulographum hederae CBS 113979 TaxID=1176131 RepID=A0A6G1GWW8_9PEZI|nr:hypothetical protein K402DRAFT_455225 [Aulographum hederae CBS 113979]
MVFSAASKIDLNAHDPGWATKFRLRIVQQLLAAVVVILSMGVVTKSSVFQSTAWDFDYRIALVIPFAICTLIFNAVNMVLLFKRRRALPAKANIIFHGVFTVCFIIAGILSIRYGVIALLRSYEDPYMPVRGYGGAYSIEITAMNGSTIIVTPQNINHCPAFPNCMVQGKWMAGSQMRARMGLVACVFFMLCIPFHVVLTILHVKLFRRDKATTNQTFRVGRRYPDKIIFSEDIQMAKSPLEPPENVFKHPYSKMSSASASDACLISHTRDASNADSRKSGAGDRGSKMSRISIQGKNSFQAQKNDLEIRSIPGRGGLGYHHPDTVGSSTSLPLGSPLPVNEKDLPSPMVTELQSSDPEKGNLEVDDAMDAPLVNPSESEEPRSKSKKKSRRISAFSTVTAQEAALSRNPSSASAMSFLKGPLSFSKRNSDIPPPPPLVLADSNTNFDLPQSGFDRYEIPRESFDWEEPNLTALPAPTRPRGFSFRSPTTPSPGLAAGLSFTSPKSSPPKSNVDPPQRGRRLHKNEPRSPTSPHAAGAPNNLATSPPGSPSNDIMTPPPLLSPSDSRPTTPSQMRWPFTAAGGIDGLRQSFQIEQGLDPSAPAPTLSRPGTRGQSKERGGGGGGRRSSSRERFGISLGGGKGTGRGRKWSAGSADGEKMRRKLSKESVTDGQREREEIEEYLRGVRQWGGKGGNGNPAQVRWSEASQRRGSASVVERREEEAARAREGVVDDGKEDVGDR